MDKKRCFLIGHHDAPESIYSALQREIERHITELGVTEFIVGHYGNFDRMAARALGEAKQAHPEISLWLLLPYHPSEQKVEVPEEFNGSFYPEGMETVPRRVAIVKANRYVVDYSDCIIAYVFYSGSNTEKLLKYSKDKKMQISYILEPQDKQQILSYIEITEDTYVKLKQGVLNVINKNNFTQFMLAIKGAGFISNKLVNSKMALDFAYALYLRLAKSKEVSVSEIKRIVQKWYVLSVLTGRYSSSPETAFYRDIRQINENGVVATLERIEAAILSDNFWNVTVVQNLAYTSTINPTYQVYLAAQVQRNDMSLLSNNISVRYLIEMGEDVHHIFPKEYLKSKGFSKNLYNQDANYAYWDTQVNKSIGQKAPHIYFSEAIAQCESKQIACGSITNLEELKEDLTANCIPFEACNFSYKDYEDFLATRRKMMAEKIKNYYYSL